MTQTLFAAAVAVAVSIAGGATYLLIEQGGSADSNVDARPCWDAPLGAPFTVDESDALIRVVVDVRGVPFEGHDEGVACVFDSSGLKRLEASFSLPADNRTVVDLPVPDGAYGVFVGTGDLDRAEQGAYGGVGFPDAVTTACAEGIVDLGYVEEFREDGMRGQGVAAECAASDLANARAADAIAPVTVADGTLPPGSGVALGLGALAVVATLAARWAYPAGLFSRLDRKRVLDQGTRSRIDDLVRQDPGIHGNEIARRLGIANGQAAYHLRVLVRERQLSSTRVRGRRHYFPFGRLGTGQMRRLATLRQPSFAAVFWHVDANPGRTLGDVAQAAGRSLSHASRIVRHLESVGLVEVEQRGRAVRITARR